MAKRTILIAGMGTSPAVGVNIEVVNASQVLPQTSCVSRLGFNVQKML